MKTAQKIVALATILILAAGAYVFLQPQEEEIYGRALVVAFVDAEVNQNHNFTLWEKLDLTMRINDSCQADNSVCIKKSINKAVSSTQLANKELIILAENNYAQGVLDSIAEIADKEISAVALLDPIINTVDAVGNKFPKVLIVNDIDSDAEKLILIRELAGKIRNLGHWVWSSQLYSDGRGMLVHPVVPHMTSYLINGLLNPAYKIEFDAESGWQHPRVNNNKFWQHDNFIEKRVITEDIRRIIKAFYAHDLSYIKQWPLETYHAFNLINYRDSLPEGKRGRYVTFSNRKGHKFYLDLERYGQFIPELVVALDDEKNLYRLTSFYKTKRYYSWEEGGPDSDTLYSQSLGAFIHFQKSLPYADELPYLQYSSILFESISFTNENPYRDITGLSNDAFKVVTLNCLPCHSFHDVGGAAYHLDSKTMQKQPGFAKPLLSYSQSILENFFYNQTETAKLIGVNPNYVDAEVASELMAWLQENNR